MDWGLFKNKARICGLNADNLRDARKQAAKLLGISITQLKPLDNIGAAWDDWDYDKHCKIEYRVWREEDMERGWHNRIDESKSSLVSR